MTEMVDISGRAVVGRLTDIAFWEAELILSMRLWMSSPEGQAEVWTGFARCFGAPAGRSEMRCFEALLSNINMHARRPLVRHGLGCDCIGSDEAILRTLVREATRGDLAEATMIASLFVPVRHAEPIAHMAAQVGKAMQAMARRAPRETDQPPDTTNRTLH